MGETGSVTPDRTQESGGAHVLALRKLTLRSVPHTGTGAQRQCVILVRVHTLPRMQRLRLVCAGAIL